MTAIHDQAPAVDHVISPQAFLDGVRAILPAIRARSAESERLGRLPEETVRELDAVGVFRALQPRQWGGLELHPITFFESVVLLGSACGSTGWAAGVLAAHPWEVALLADDAQRKVWAHNNHARISSSYAPTGTVRPPGRVWAAVDAHQIPYWGRGRARCFQKGWSGSHRRRLRGYRLYLVVDTATGQVITFLLARGRMRDARLIALLARRLRHLLGRRLAGLRPQQGRWLRDGGAVCLGSCPWDDRLWRFALGARTATDRRGPWVYVTTLRRPGPQALAAQYRQRWRVEQVIDELVNGHDLDHLVGTRLHANQVAVGFRLLARNLAIGQRIADAGARPAIVQKPPAFRAAHVDGLGTFTVGRRTIRLQPLQPRPAARYSLPWTRCVVRIAPEPELSDGRRHAPTASHAVPPNPSPRAAPRQCACPAPCRSWTRPRSRRRRGSLS